MSDSINKIPEGYTFRKLESSDYSNNYLETLTVLTTVGDISKESFEKLYASWASVPDIYQPHVITNKEGKIVATGMLLIERKAIHCCGLVGHIEDISVSTTEQGKKLGLLMIKSLTQIGESRGCYKVILDCSEHNVGFYEKCGYKKDGVEMACRF